MLVIKKFPKNTAGHTKCSHKPYAARVFETPDLKRKHKTKNKS